MRKVKCFECSQQKPKEEMFQATIGKAVKNFCDENCFNKNREPVEYRRRIIGILYSILNIKFKDGGTLINKKLKELDSYDMKQIYDVIDENQFEMQMYVPVNGTLYQKINYAFAIIKSKLYEIDNPTQKVEIKTETEQVEQVTQTVPEEDIFVPMKSGKRKQEKKDEDIELTIDF